MTRTLHFSSTNYSESLRHARKQVCDSNPRTNINIYSRRSILLGPPHNLIDCKTPNQKSLRLESYTISTNAFLRSIQVMLEAHIAQPHKDRAEEERTAMLESKKERKKERSEGRQLQLQCIKRERERERDVCAPIQSGSIDRCATSFPALFPPQNSLSPGHLQESEMCQ